MKVVEVASGSIAASYTTSILRQLGHEVTKVEPLGDDSLRRRPLLGAVGQVDGDNPLFIALNAGKRIVGHDLDTDEGRGSLGELLAESQALVYQPPLLTSADVNALRSRPELEHLLVCSVSPLGESGPLATGPAYPINATALGGASVGIGRALKRPLTMPLELGQYHAGVIAATGVLAAYLRRDQGGHFIEISEADVWASVHTGQNILTYLYLGVSGVRDGNHGVGQYPNTFLRCKDGYICITLPALPQWIKFVELMGTPEWSKDPRYRDRRAMTEEYPDEVDELICRWLRERTKAEIFDLARSAGLAIVPALSFDEVLANPHLQSRGAFRPIDGPYGEKLCVPRIPWLVRHLPDAADA